MIRYEMLSEFTGYPPIHLQFGSTGLSSKFTVFDIPEGNVISNYFIKVQEFGFRLLRFKVINENYEEVKSHELNGHYAYQSAEFQQVKGDLVTNLIGAKVT